MRNDVTRYIKDILYRESPPPTTTTYPVIKKSMCDAERCRQASCMFCKLNPNVDHRR